MVTQDQLDPEQQRSVVVRNASERFAYNDDNTLTSSDGSDPYIETYEDTSQKLSLFQGKHSAVGALSKGYESRTSNASDSSIPSVVTPEEKDDGSNTHIQPSEEMESQKKPKGVDWASERLWILLSVLITICTGGVGVTVYFFFFNDEAESSANQSSASRDGPLFPPLTQVPSNINSMDPSEFWQTDSPTVSASLSENPIATIQPSQSPTTSNTISPTVKPTSALYDLIIPALETTVYEKETLLDPMSVEGATVEWLVRENSLILESDEKIVQRYAIVVAAAALHGQPIDSIVAFPNIVDPYTDECSWEGITCRFQDEFAVAQLAFNQTNNLNISAEELQSLLMKRVKEIQWVNHSLSGTIPKDIGLLTSLTMLDLGNNEIDGHIPESLYDLYNLTYLYLHQNSLTGTISKGIEKLQKLVELMLFDNNLIGQIPSELGSRDGAVKRPLGKSPLQSIYIF